MFLEGHGKRGGSTKQDYVDQVLKPVVGPAFDGQLSWDFWDDDGLFQEDNASIHGTRNSGRLAWVKKELGIRIFDWPASSPDLSPIEMCGGSLNHVYAIDNTLLGPAAS